MYDKYKISIRKNYDLLLAPFITAAILLACFIIGKIYPFGSNNVEYYDMAQGIIPNFYHLWYFGLRFLFCRGALWEKRWVFMS